MHERAPAAETTPPPRRDWNGVSAVIAALIGLLALLVSGYTAWLQREQVRAQVWPRLLLMSSDTQQEWLVMNKGVGPALVRSVRIRFDGAVQRDWAALAAALRLEPDEYVQSTVNGTVLSGGERYVMAQFPERAVWERVRPQLARVERRLCFCSTLDECWVVESGGARREDRYRAVGRCERNEAEEFND